MRSLLMALVFTGICAGSVPAQEAEEAAPAQAAQPAEETAQPEPGSAMEAVPPPSAPEAEPKPIPPVPGAAVELRTEVEIAKAHLDFLRGLGDSKEEDSLEAALPRVADWLRTWPAGEGADEALLLKANLQQKLGDHKSSVVTLLRHAQEFPGSPLRDNVRLLLNTTIDRKFSKKMKDPLNALADAGNGRELHVRLADLLVSASGQFGSDLYEPLMAELGEYLVRFPVSPQRDAVLLAMGDMYASKRGHLAARHAYEEVIAVYPASALLARAKRSLADVLSDGLKDYFGAIKVYTEVAETFPGTEEAWAAYTQLPRLTERQKQYDKAVEVYEKIIALYPDKPEARMAFKSEARVLREELKKPAEAIAVLNRLADKYKDEKVVDELYLAAEIAKKDLKDLALEVKQYDRIAEDYAGTKDAPKALLTAGQAYEKAKDKDKAKEYYNKIVEKYPDDAMAKKAQKSVEALLKN